MRVFFAWVMSTVLLFLLSGCAVGHDDYVNYLNSSLGSKMPYKEPYQPTDAGKIIRSDFLIGGQGLTDITSDENGFLIYHFSHQEVLSNIKTKDWVGKCLIYYVVDPKTYIIKSWGFDDGGNPLSCRTWL